MNDVLSLKVEDWPHDDRVLLQRALRPAAFLQPANPASSWSPSRRRIVEQSVGQWLAWLLRNGLLDPDCAPADRVTRDRIEAFVAELADRVAPWSVAMMLGALVRGFEVMSPDRDFNWIKPACQSLKERAEPSRNAFAHLVSPGELFQLGLDLMQEARDLEASQHPYVSTQARDGLMLAVLISFPVRIRNFTETRIGQHLLSRDGCNVLKYSAEETKTGSAQVGELPPNLAEWLDWYLSVHRERLLARGTGPKTDRLWVNRDGDALDASAIREQIKRRTKSAFGRHVWPHLFRKASATGLVDDAPDSISLAAEVLGHATIQTTERHYVLARGSMAHKEVQSTVLTARSDALARLRRKTRSAAANRRGDTGKGGD
ncbi:site-specific integrase [Tabrizicola sp. J26]|uniref:tyrosine-type recombinase/integrase n=1 Tax=Alitabrizicola rongguiensis TaxID=2909234 RepID=UPI001F492410|nr:site-specific integrase [Tabrizicola rongguiensis]MCF1709455.1 site-specific integrase [Tabrizicola rongguiensis]